MNHSATHELKSPCIQNCCLDNNDMCLGCFRMMEEILIWGQADEKQKREIMTLCQSRKKNCIKDWYK